MKAKLTKIIMLILLLTLIVSCVVACSDKNYKVTVMDGETEVATFEVKPGETLSKDDVLAKMEKTGYEFVGLYADAEFTKPFVFEDEVIDTVTLYAKYTQKTLYISVKQGDGESEVAKVAVTNGEAYTVPIPTKEGYEFAGYTYLNDEEDEVAFPTTGTYNFTTNIRLTAHWNKKKCTVTFKGADETVLATQANIEYGTKASAITLTGYTVDGYYLDKEFTEANKITLSAYEVKSNVSIYVKKTARTYTLTVDGWHEATIQVTYGAAYALVSPEDTTNAIYTAKIGTGADNEWATFIGYTYNNQEFPATGTYTYAENITVLPIHTLNPNYDKATVTFWDTVANEAFGTVTVSRGSTIASTEFPATGKTGYAFGGWFTAANYAQDSAFTTSVSVNASVKVYAKYTANAHTITVKDTNASGATLATVPVTYGSEFSITDPSKFGFSFQKYMLGTVEFDPDDHETYDIDEDIVLFAIFVVDENAGDPNFVKNSEKSYFKERASENDPWTYVFVTGGNYAFSGYTMASTANGQYISIASDGLSFDATAPGEFTLDMTAVAGGAKVTVPAKVVYDVRNIGFGNDFAGMLLNAASDSSFQSTVTEEEYVMDAGITRFIPDISIQNNNLADITMEQANIIIETREGNALFDGGYTLTGSTVNFVNAADAYTGRDVITLTFRPKYTFSESTKETLKVKFNTGVNVYTDAELRAEYAKESVQCVNVLRNITAVLPESDYVSDYGKRGDITLNNGGTPVTLENWDLGIPYNQYGRGVYRRTTNSKTDNVVVNGNYFAIDGTRLPFVTDYSSRTSGNSYDLMEVQVGIFMYRCVDIDYTGNKRDINRRYSDGTVSINNLKIQGNARKDLSIATETVQGKEHDLLKMSAAFIGIVVRGGTLNLNNTTVTNTTMGIMLDGGVSGYGGGSFAPGATNNWVYDENETQSVKLNVNNGLFSACWSNNIYAYNLCAVDLKNTKLESCNGASIHFDDLAYAKTTNENCDNTCGYSNLNSSLKMDTYTAQNLQNWVLGSEAWFQAYGQVGAAGLIKTNVEAMANASGKTILQSSNEGTRMNFAILVNPSGSGTWASDKDEHVKVDTPQIYNAGSGAILFLGDGETPGANSQPILSFFVGDYAAQLGAYINMHLYLPLYPKA